MMSQNDLIQWIMYDMIAPACSQKRLLIIGNSYKCLLMETEPVPMRMKKLSII